jgi:hypothetical protein
MRVLVVIGAVIGLLIVPLTASDLPLWQVLGVSIAIGAALGLATGFVIWMWRRPGRVRYGVAVSPMPIAAQTASFDNVTRPRDGGPYPCPCCGCVTLPERGGYELCPVCFWEDDGQDDHDADQVRGGPNGSLSLTEARRSFSRIGAVEERLLPYVRPPTDGERPR